MCAKLIFYLSFLFVSGTKGTDNAAPSCGETSYGYVYACQTGHCYKFHTQAEDWTTAQWVCAGEDARLAVINSDAEAKYLEDLFGQYPPEALHGASRADYIPIGVYYESGGWRTVDGLTLNQAGYAKWKPGRPSEIVYFPYVYMDRKGMLNNGSFNAKKLAFICEKAPVPLCSSPFTTSETIKIIQ